MVNTVVRKGPRQKKSASKARPQAEADPDLESSAQGKSTYEEGAAVETPEMRLQRLLSFDSQLLNEYRSASTKFSIVNTSVSLIGTDEVGRGCLAGPVVAAAVIMPPIEHPSPLAAKLLLMNDSKQVKADDRQWLADVLKENCLYAIAEASVAEIDSINILYASLLAMRRAVRRLEIASEALIAVDGNKKIKSLRMNQITVVDGDTKSASIAAASIIAKVYRDQLMTKLAQKFPQYSWDSNKGYRSRAHWDALDNYGMTKWHRRSFVEKWLAKT